MHPLAASSTRLLRTSCLRLAHQHPPLRSVRFLRRVSRTDAHNHVDSLRRPPPFHEEPAKADSEKAQDAAAQSESSSGSGSGSGPGLASAGRPTTFRAELLKEDPTFEQPRFQDGVGTPKIWKHVAFACVLSGVVYINAAEHTNIDTRRIRSMLRNQRLVTSENLRRVRVTLLSEKLKAWLATVKDAISDLPTTVSYPILWAYVKCGNWYISLPEGKRICYQICAINGVVFLMWQMKFLKPFMQSNFLHHPLSGKYFTLLTSVFSHQSLIHLLANSFALVGFGSAATAYLAKSQANNKEGLLESTPKYHFWALFVSAGLFSALVSHVVTTRVTLPRLLAQLRAPSNINVTSGASTVTGTAFRRTGAAAKEKATEAAPRNILPSLGASGAIYATVTLTALAFPDAQVFLIFPPIPMPITWGVGGMVALDVIGVLRGWRLFDHWAHLGGAAFGAIYYKYGPDFWNYNRAIHAKRVLGEA